MNIPGQNRKPSRQRLYGLLMGAGLLLLLAGCSLRVTYPVMDWWIKWQIQDYVSFNPEQKQHLKNSLQRFHQWHQDTQLSAYARQLEDLKSLLAQDQVTEQQMTAMQEQAQQHWQVSLDYLLPDIQTLFLSLSDQQWGEFQDNLIKKEAEKTAKMRKASGEKRYRLRRESMEDRLEDWFGRLTSEQENLLRHWSEQLNPLAEISLQEQRHWLQLADELFQQRFDLPPEQQQQAIRKLITDETRFWSEPHLQLLKENRQLNRRLLSQLHDSLTERQRERLTNKLSSFQKDLEYLARRNEEDNLAQRE